MRGFWYGCTCLPGASAPGYHLPPAQVRAQKYRGLRPLYSHLYTSMLTGTSAYLSNVILGIMLEVNLLRQYEDFYIEINVAPSSLSVNYRGEYCCHPLSTQKWATNHFVTHWWVTNLVVTHLARKSGQQTILSPTGGYQIPLSPT